MADAKTLMEYVSQFGTWTARGPFDVDITPRDADDDDSRNSDVSEEPEDGQ